jgi:hypothetical protein
LSSPGDDPDAGAHNRPMKFGLQPWSQAADSPGVRDAALRAEATAWESRWTWDHLISIIGPDRIGEVASALAG